MSFINVPSQRSVFHWDPACWLRATGEDAFTFLQGQFTNDLKSVASGAAYGLWLTVKGKVLADSVVVREPATGAYWIGSYFSPVETIRERLESYIIADDVTLENHTADWAGVTVIGPGAAEEAARARTAAALPGFVFPGRRVGAENVDWVFPRDAAARVAAALGSLPTLEPAEVERRRIAAGIPAVPRDVGPADLPNEGGLDVDAISYQKGCYLGQEVMARLKAMGQVRRRLWRVRSALLPPAELPCPLFAGARQVGELRSAVAEPTGGFIGLAMLSLLHVSAGAELALTADGERTVRLMDTP